jgi:hypothetical protein
MLNSFGLASDKEVDDQIYLAQKLNRLIINLPVLPLTNPPQDIQDASTDRVVYKYWLKLQNFQAAKEYLAMSERGIENYLQRLEVDYIRYGVIV